MSEAAPQGPYGPNNPPPPPMGPPPRKSGRTRGRSDRGEPPHPQDSQASNSPGRSFLNRKLNSRQRKKFYEAQEKAGEGRGRGRSRSPTIRRDQNREASYRERSPMRSESDRGQFVSSSPPGSGHRKSRLRDARQYTPDQIVDETYGRLSPPGNQSRYTSAQTDLRRTNRTWPHEEQSFSGRHSGKQFGQACRDALESRDQREPSSIDEESSAQADDIHLQTRTSQQVQCLNLKLRHLLGVET
jgi:hypothetical protein